jgi:hypothetical protein
LSSVSHSGKVGGWSFEDQLEAFFISILVSPEGPKKSQETTTENTRIRAIKLK